MTGELFCWEILVLVGCLCQWLLLGWLVASVASGPLDLINFWDTDPFLGPLRLTRLETVPLYCE